MEEFEVFTIAGTRNLENKDGYGNEATLYYLYEIAIRTD